MARPAYIVIFTTVNKRDEAEKLAGLLVKEKAAACVSISAPVQSVYWWQQNVTIDQEWLMMIKTVAANYPTVEKIIRENHSYSVPEILALPVIRGSEPYLRWMRENTVIT